MNIFGDEPLMETGFIEPEGGLISTTAPACVGRASRLARCRAGVLARAGFHSASTCLQGRALGKENIYEFRSRSSGKSCSDYLAESLLRGLPATDG